MLVVSCNKKHLLISPSFICNSTVAFGTQASSMYCIQHALPNISFELLCFCGIPRALRLITPIHTGLMQHATGTISMINGTLSQWSLPAPQGAGGSHPCSSCTLTRAGSIRSAQCAVMPSQSVKVGAFATSLLPRSQGLQVPLSKTPGGLAIFK
jgi:hypothetical protein